MASSHLRVSSVREIQWNVVLQEGEIRGAFLMYRKSSKNNTQARKNKSIKHGQRVKTIKSQVFKGHLLWQVWQEGSNK